MQVRLPPRYEWKPRKVPDRASGTRRSDKTCRPRCRWAARIHIGHHERRGGELGQAGPAGPELAWSKAGWRRQANRPGQGFAILRPCPILSRFTTLRELTGRLQNYSSYQFGAHCAALEGNAACSTLVNRLRQFQSSSFIQILRLDACHIRLVIPRKSGEGSAPTGRNMEA